MTPTRATTVKRSATGIRTRCRGRAVTSSSPPERWWGWPAVTVTRARAPGRRAPGRPAPRAKWTSFPWRVRPVSIDSSRRLTPSTSTSSRPADPGLVAGQRGAVDHRLEPLEALGDDVGGHELLDSMAAARVPGRGEKMKV